MQKTECQAVKFYHEECGNYLNVQFLSSFPDGKIYLVGECTHCGYSVRFDLEQALGGLFGASPSKAVN